MNFPYNWVTHITKIIDLIFLEIKGNEIISKNKLFLYMTENPMRLLEKIHMPESINQHF